MQLAVSIDVVLRVSVSGKQRVWCRRNYVSSDRAPAVLCARLPSQRFGRLLCATTHAGSRCPVFRAALTCTSLPSSLMPVVAAWRNLLLCLLGVLRCMLGCVVTRTFGADGGGVGVCDVRVREWGSWHGGSWHGGAGMGLNGAHCVNSRIEICRGTVKRRSAQTTTTVITLRGGLQAWQRQHRQSSVLAAAAGCCSFATRGRGRGTASPACRAHHDACKEAGAPVTATQQQG